MKLRQSIFLMTALAMIAALSACSSSSSPSNNNTTPTITIAATSGGSQSATVSTAFAAPLVAIVTTNGSATSGATVTFTAPSSGASGTFQNGTATDTETTNSSGVATSTAFTANATAGAYTVTASTSGASTSASFSLTNNAVAGVTVSISGAPTALQLGATASLTATVVNDSTNAGVTWSVTCNTTNGCGALSNTTTTAATYTAPSAVPSGNSVTVTATSNASSSATASSTIFISGAPTALTAGIYVFSVSGADANGPYSVAGAFTVAASGAISGGEQDFIDVDPNSGAARPLSDQISATGSSYATSADGNVQFTLNTGDPNIGPNGDGVETLDATLVSANRALIVEFDASATSSGSMDLQTANPAQPTGPYAFFLSGEDAASGGGITVLGGILNIDNAGGTGNISGTGSVFDIDDANFTPAPDQLFSASSVTAPDGFGRVGFTLNPASTFGQIDVIGYVVGPAHIRLVETGDGYGGITGGVALGQTGTITNAGISGSSYVFGTEGQDSNGLDQVAGVLTLTATSATAGTVSGIVNYNDMTLQNTQGGTVFNGVYTFDTTDPGRIIVSSFTDGGPFTYNLQLYLDGNGNAVEISVDTSDWLAGLGFQQSGSISASTFAGNYALNVVQFLSTTNGNVEFDGVGPVTADGVGSLTTGFVDFNGTPDVPLTGTFTAGSNGVFTGSITGIDASSSTGADNFTYYVVDGTKVEAIENDANGQLTLGYFELQ